MALKNYNRHVEEYFYTNKRQAGEVGIEIEVEGARLPQEIPSYWAVHRDGSLRGESAEYVLAKPTSRGNVLRFLQYLKKKLDDNHADVEMSNRTSVHVHINQQGMQIRQVFSLICLYLLVEDLLVNLAGPLRVGNLFCLRARDAEYLITTLARCLDEDDYAAFTQENRLRYASLNVCALPKFNSLEFRAFRGTIEPEPIHGWVKLLLALKDAALRYPDPRSIFQDFSGMGPRGFLRNLFPETPEIFGSNWVEIEHNLWEGARNIQDIAYAINWEVADAARPRIFASEDNAGRRPPEAIPDWADDRGDALNAAIDREDQERRQREVVRQQQHQWLVNMARVPAPVLAAGGVNPLLRNPGRAALGIPDFDNN